MRKKLIALISAGLLLTGCAAAEAPATTGEAVPSTPEEDFLGEFHGTNPNSDRASDEQWLDLGHAVCNALDSGASPNQVIDVMQGDDTDPDEMASLVVLATEHLCPEFSP